jgi:hypothetical protein
MRGIALLALWLTTLGLASPAFAETAEAAQAEQSRRDRERLVADNLPMTEPEAKAFWPLYQRFEQDLSALTQRRRGILNTLGEHYDAMSDAMAKQVTIDSLDYQEARLKLMRGYLPKFEKVLPLKKLARFYQIEARIRAAVDAEIAERIPLIQ